LPGRATPLRARKSFVRKKLISRALSIRSAASRAFSKIFRFFRSEISRIFPAIPSPEEGRTRRHERWAREAMDALASHDERGHKRTAKSCGPDPPTLGSSWLKMIRRRRWLKSPVRRGEHEAAVKTNRAGKAGSLRLNLWFLTRVLSSLHTRPRVQPASGFPCALHGLEGSARPKSRTPGAARRLGRGHSELSPSQSTKHGCCRATFVASSQQFRNIWGPPQVALACAAFWPHPSMK
jgi:hypothetical protein